MARPTGEARRRASRRVVQLDGVRAIAALSVICFHVWLYRTNRPYGSRSELLDQVLFHASEGLICFFVLSGYLLYGAFARAALTGERRVALGTYARRRAARILPAAWVCVAGCLLLYWLVGYSAITPPPQELALFALFLQNYSASTMGDLNPVMWTLCVEIAFYALLPLVGWAAWRLGPRRARAQLALVVGLIAVTPAWNVLKLSQGWDVVASRALPAYLGSFGVGMLVALWAQRRRTKAPPARPLSARASAALLAGGALILVVDAVWRENGWWLRSGVFEADLLRPRVQLELLGHLGAATGFALVIAAAACGRGPAVRWLSWRPLAALGTISYGLYLWHLPLLLVMRQAGLLPHAIAPRLLVVLAISIVAATASWHWIERPWIERGRIARGRRGRVATPAIAATEAAG